MRFMDQKTIWCHFSPNQCTVNQNIRTTFVEVDNSKMYIKIQAAKLEGES